MEVRDWRLSDIKPYPNNPRKRSKRAIEKVAASIREFGARQPIVVDENGIILVGHTRYDAALLLGMETFPVHQALGLSEAQKVAYRIADNRTNEETEWDDEKLRIEFASLGDLDLTLTGFDLRQVTSYIRGGPQVGEDDVPADAAPRVKAGDLWRLGEHRLLCADCTDPGNVARLLDGATPLLMVTDPPYGVSLDHSWRDKQGINKRNAPGSPGYMMRSAGHGNTTISGDTIADWSHAFELVPSLQVAYVWHASKFTAEVLLGLRRLNFTAWQSIIWAKDFASFTHDKYWYQHEPCWFVRKPGAPWYTTSGASNGTVWKAASPKAIYSNSQEEKVDHPTQKPVELMRRAIVNHTQRGESVYEPFCGSGTTLIACETEGRRCFGLEIEPKYCDVIIARWEKLTGKTAALESSRATAA